MVADKTDSALLSSAFFHLEVLPVVYRTVICIYSFNPKRSTRRLFLAQGNIMNGQIHDGTENMYVRANVIIVF